jgi:predicted 3-demethylubiquinone-9 3-methyltransferase (glyoxalase superfamily)
MAKIKPFLLFQGKAEEAMNFYVSLFDNAMVLDIVRYTANESGTEGSIKKAEFAIGDQTILCTDSTVIHPFSFTASFSLFVECQSEDEITRLYDTLATEGNTPMPIENYGFNQKFAWVNDRYGVSWQLNLA